MSDEDDGKISREDWRALAISRYADVERYRNQLDTAREALNRITKCGFGYGEAQEIAKAAIADLEKDIR